jgi:DNA-nicking Smr family endonuclease
MQRSDPFDPLDGTPSDTLDLHGFTAGEAIAHLGHYLARARKRAPGGLLHVITGKGRNSAKGSVLKPAVRSYLRENAARHVATWSKDHDDSGFLIRLKGGRW